MIIAIKDETTKDIYDGVNTKAARKIPKELWNLAQRKMDMINAVKEIMDLRVPPGNRLEALKGNLAGFNSIRINEQYRIVFKFENGNASEVKITDYHK